MLATRTACELRCRKSSTETLARLWGYIESCPTIPDSPGIAVLGGSVGDDAFTIRYSAFTSVVRVSGKVRSRDGLCEVFLLFREERQPLVRLALTACSVACAIYFLPSAFEAWIRWGMPLLLGATSLLLPASGTSPGFANSVADDLARVLGAERA